jgi:hypothetical protein
MLTLSIHGHQILHALKFSTIVHGTLLTNKKDTDEIFLIDNQNSPPLYNTRIKLSNYLKTIRCYLNRFLNDESHIRRPFTINYDILLNN